MVAGTLYSFGLFLGRNASSPIFEDNSLDALLASSESSGKSASSAQLELLLDEYNRHHAVWAFKRPQVATGNLELIHRAFRNPIYVFCFRDLFSIANRNLISAGTELVPSMRSVLKDYVAILDFLEQHQPYALLVSYDKALHNKKLFLAELIDFCELEVGEERILRAQEFIDPTPKEYLDYSNRTRDARGYLDAVLIDAVKGWVKTDGGTPEQVVLVVDGREIARTTANRYREDLVSQDPTSGGHCAYVFEKLDSALIQPGTEVRVRTVNGGIELINSPFRVTRRAKSVPVGVVEKVAADEVAGRAQACSDQPAELLLLVGGREIARTLADGPQGRFRFGGLKEGMLKPGSEVRVVTLQERVDLDNSPYVVVG